MRYNKIGHTLASPQWNRVALGVAAITSQPWWDYFNPKVDDDTAKASAIRTGSKIGVCTTIGFTIRSLAHAFVKKFANGSTKEGSTLLTPKEILREINPEIKECKLKLHQNTFAFFVALFVMMFTNFLIDAPLTTYVANKFLAKADLKDASQGERYV